MSDASEISSAYSYEEARGIPLVTLDVSLSKFPLGKVEKVGNEIVGKLQALRPKDLLVDLSSTEFIGSALVALVVRLWKTVKDRGGRTVVAIGGEGVREVLGLARLDQHWTIVDSRDDALRALGLGKLASGPPAPGSAHASTMNPLVAILAVLGIIGAACGAVLLATKSALVAPDVALYITGGAALVGLVAGTLLVLGAGTSRKVVGTLALIVCAGAIVVALALYAPNGT